MVLTLPGIALSAGAASPGVKTSAHFVTEVWGKGNSCTGAFGIEFKKVRGATHYTFRYLQTVNSKTSTVTFSNENAAALLVGYAGPRPRTGSGLFIIAATICSSKNPYAAMSSHPEAFAILARR